MKEHLIRIVAAIHFALPICMIWLSDAWSATENFCSNYAQRAVDESRINSELNCGFTGPRWITDYNAHYRWCLSVPESIAQGEAKARVDELTKCRTKKSTENNSATMKPLPGYGQTKPPAKTINNATLTTIAEILPGSCFYGTGHCMYLLPKVTRLYDSDKNGDKAILAQWETYADLIFPSNKSGIKYACAFIPQANKENITEYVSIEKVRDLMRTKDTKGFATRLISSEGQCSTRMIPKDKQFTQTARSGWTGMMIIVSDHPMYVDAYTSKSDIKTANYGDNASIGSLGYTSKQFIGGPTLRTNSAYPIDCRSPQDYEGVCEFGNQLLKMIRGR